MVARDPEEGIALARADNAFLIVELLLIGLLLIGLARPARPMPRPQPSCWRPLHGRLLGPGGRPRHPGAAADPGAGRHHRIAHTSIAPVLVMLGSLALRFVVVYAGQYSHWARV